MSANNSTRFTPVHYNCRLCGDTIWSKYEGEFVSCKCGAISVDQTIHYTRLIGERENFLPEVLWDGMS